MESRSILNQVIVYRYYDPQNKLGMRVICQKYWKGRYYSTFRRRVRDKVKGFRVASGGKGKGKGQPSSGKPNHFVHVDLIF